MELNLVLNYGRVGSIGITEALNRADCGPVFHLHKSNEKIIGAELVRRLEAGIPIPQDLLWSSALEIFKKSGNLLNIICPIREPFSRDISLLTYGQPHPDQYIATHDFVEDFFSREVSFGSNWLVSNLMSYTEIDFLSVPFDKQKGYSVYIKNNIRLMILKTELSNEAKGLALQALLKTAKPPAISDKINSSGYSDEASMTIGPRLLQDGFEPIRVDRLISTLFYTPAEVKKSIQKFNLSLEQLSLPKDF